VVGTAFRRHRLRSRLRPGARAARRRRGAGPRARSFRPARRPRAAPVLGRADEPMARRPRRRRAALVVVLLRHASRDDGTGPAAVVAAHRRLSPAPRRADRRESRRSRRLLALSGRAAPDAARLRRHGAVSSARGVQSRGGERQPLRRAAVAPHGVGAVVRCRAVDAVRTLVGALRRRRPSTDDGGHRPRHRQPLHARPADRRHGDGAGVPADRVRGVAGVRASRAARSEATGA